MKKNFINQTIVNPFGMHNKQFFYFYFTLLFLLHRFDIFRFQWLNRVDVGEVGWVQRQGCPVGNDRKERHQVEKTFMYTFTHNLLIKS